MALYFFLDGSDKNSYIFINHPQFLPIREKLREKQYKDNLQLLSQFCLIPVIIFIKIDTNVMADVTTINNDCNNHIKSIENQMTLLDDPEIQKRFEELKEKKEYAFQSFSKKNLFLRAANYLCAPLTKTESFKKICKEIENFSMNEE